MCCGGRQSCQAKFPLAEYSLTWFEHAMQARDQEGGEQDQESGADIYKWAGEQKRHLISDLIGLGGIPDATLVLLRKRMDKDKPDSFSRHTVWRTINEAYAEVAAEISLKTVDEEGRDTKEPFVWNIINVDSMLNELIAISNAFRLMTLNAISKAKTEL